MHLRCPRVRSRHPPSHVIVFVWGPEPRAPSSLLHHVLLLLDHSSSSCSSSSWSSTEASALQPPLHLHFALGGNRADVGPRKADERDTWVTRVRDEVLRGQVVIPLGVSETARVLLLPLPLPFLLVLEPQCLVQLRSVAPQEGKLLFVACGHHNGVHPLNLLAVTEGNRPPFPALRPLPDRCDLCVVRGHGHDALILLTLASREPERHDALPLNTCPESLPKRGEQRLLLAALLGQFELLEALAFVDVGQRAVGFVDNVEAPLDLRDPAGPLSEAPTASSDEEKPQADDKRAEFPPQLQEVNPRMLVAVLEEVGDEDIQGLLLGHEMRDGQEPFPHDDANAIRLPEHGALCDVHRCLSTTEDEHIPVLEDRLLLVFARVDADRIWIRLESTNARKFLFCRDLGHVVQAAADRHSMKCFILLACQR
mmetsp:Transcript_58068/g.136605  ORF Transcript_58068/g.136605 Transcript_58068/m.136605 type:complete len:425 (-) Transcript_58068:184-1458(-)